MSARRASALLSPPQRPRLACVAEGPWCALLDALCVDDGDGAIRGQYRDVGARTRAGGFGCFDLRPRRLADIGYMRDIRVGADGRAYGVFCGRTAAGAARTEESFLRDLDDQHAAVLESLRRYDLAEAALVIQGLGGAKFATRSSALALLHRLGPRALEKWREHKSRSTVALFRRTNNLF